MSLRKSLLSGAAVVLAIISISIIWQLLNADYPTHSDVFFMGVEAGALAVVLLVCLSLMGFLLYRLVTIPKNKT
jgi:dolichyl-phosphate-mannose--protein O-mannosyl transferase